MLEFEKIYTTYFLDVFRYILKLSNDEHIAEDITSQTFLNAMQSIDNFRGDCDIRVWLCQIAKNCYYTYIKKSKKFECMEDIENLYHWKSEIIVEEQILQDEETLKIKKILHDIPNPYKEVFMWRVFAGMSFKQIGQIFKKSENWACVTYHRGRNKIKEKLEEKSDER